MIPEDTLRRLREEEFPVTAQYAYLNHAATGPLPQRAARRMEKVAQEISATGDRYWSRRMAGIERVRVQLAKLLGARAPREVAFVENTSVALSLVAEGLDWKPGDNVVGAKLEYPANVYPWMHLARRGVLYRLAEERDGRIDPEELISLIDDRTRVLALSWVQYASGFRSDLARLGAVCRERGILFVVDVIQGLGALQLDVEAAGVDIAAGAVHKWLLGPEGVGYLYVSDRVIERLRPLRSGARSPVVPFQWTDFDLTWNEGAKRFESGTMNVYGIAALGASLEILQETGIENVEQRVLSLADRAARGLAGLGFSVVSSRRPGETSGIVTATHPGRAPEELFRKLTERGVIVAYRAKRLRVSPHFYNTEGEIDRFLEEVASRVSS
jgi:selenocysteine lyase/cysteine desulfurase